MMVLDDFPHLQQARCTLFKTDTARVASKKAEPGVWGRFKSPSGGVRGRSPLRKFLGVLDALS